MGSKLFSLDADGFFREAVLYKLVETSIRLAERFHFSAAADAIINLQFLAVGVFVGVCRYHLVTLCERTW